MVVAGTESAVLMVESEAQELTEDQMLGGVLFGHDAMQIAIKAIKELAAEAGKPRWEVPVVAQNERWRARSASLVKADLGAAYRTTDKQERQAKIGALRAHAVETLAGGDAPQFSAADVDGLFGKLEKQIVASARAERRTADRRTRPAQGPADFDRSRHSAEGSRFGAVHAR